MAVTPIASPRRRIGRERSRRRAGEGNRNDLAAAAGTGHSEPKLRIRMGLQALSETRVWLDKAKSEDRRVRSSADGDAPVTHALQPHAAIRDAGACGNVA